MELNDKSGYFFIKTDIPDLAKEMLKFAAAWDNKVFTPISIFGNNAFLTNIEKTKIDDIMKGAKSEDAVVSTAPFLRKIINRAITEELLKQVPDNSITFTFTVSLTQNK